MGATVVDFWAGVGRALRTNFYFFRQSFKILFAYWPHFVKIDAILSPNPFTTDSSKNVLKPTGAAFIKSNPLSISKWFISPRLTASNNRHNFCRSLNRLRQCYYRAYTKK